MRRHLPVAYPERVYAGVLGKLIGVYLGRPFEGWSYERISITRVNDSGLVRRFLWTRTDPAASVMQTYITVV